MRGSPGPHLHFLKLNRLLMLASLVLPLAELVKVLAIIDDAANRRVRRGGNFHEVKTLPTRDPQSFVGRHDSELSALFIDHPDFPGPNPFVYSNKSVGDRHSLLAPWGLPLSLCLPGWTKDLFRSGGKNRAYHFVALVSISCRIQPIKSPSA
jgi:hypothetical protein